MEKQLGTRLPEIRTTVPGPGTKAWVDLLAQHECPAITARRKRRASSLGSAESDPIVWASARGANVQDADGNIFVDLTSGFGVALVGHTHPKVVQAITQQSQKLLHASGDTWPDTTRISLLQRLAEVTPGDLEVSILGLSGSDAVEGAIKTAVLATGRPNIITFDHSYHGLQLGVLALQGYKPAFRKPFESLIRTDLVTQLPWGCDETILGDALSNHETGLVLAEPILGRGGMIPAPKDWLKMVKAVAHEHGALFALDEIQSGMGRTGKWFAADHHGVTPDLMAIGKALGGGLPLSALIGRREVMEKWGASAGEALHTQTFLGHPLGCAAALAVLNIIDEEQILGQVCSIAEHLRAGLSSRGFDSWGTGLMIGVRVGPDAYGVTQKLLKRGFLTLPAGTENDIIGLTPPAVLTKAQADGFLDALMDCVK